MLTLAFMRHQSTDKTIASAARIDVEHKKCAIVVRVFRKLHADDSDRPTEFLITKSGFTANDFASCFVSNEAGKTIDRIGPITADIAREGGCESLEQSAN